MTEDAPATTLDVRQNDTDIDSAKELIVSTATGAATHGTVSITHSGADLTYTPAADYCNAGAPNDAAPDATFTYSLSGGASATVSIAVTCVSDPPVISGGGTLSYTENDGPKQVSGALSVVEPEGEAITGATASITAGYAAGQDALTWTDDLGDNISRDISSDAQTLVLTGTGTAAEYQAALRQVSYTNSSDSPDTTDRTVTYTATDASNTTGSGTATVHVAAVNDAPVATDDSYTTDEDTALTKSAADGVLANDTDADHDPLTATLVTARRTRRASRCTPTARSTTRPQRTTTAATPSPTRPTTARRLDHRDRDDHRQLGERRRRSRPTTPTRPTRTPP